MMKKSLLTSHQQFSPSNTNIHIFPIISHFITPKTHTQNSLTPQKLTQHDRIVPKDKRHTVTHLLYYDETGEVWSAGDAGVGVLSVRSSRSGRIKQMIRFEDDRVTALEGISSGHVKFSFTFFPLPYFLLLLFIFLFFSSHFFSLLFSLLFLLRRLFAVPL
jgi:hypothetical protein